MRKQVLGIVGLTVLLATGCGGTKDSVVIEAPPVNEPEMTAEDAAAYEKELQKSMQAQ